MYQKYVAIQYLLIHQLFLSYLPISFLEVWKKKSDFWRNKFNSFTVWKPSKTSHRQEIAVILVLFCYIGGPFSFVELLFFGKIYYYVNISTFTGILDQNVNFIYVSYTDVSPLSFCHRWGSCAKNTKLWKF